MVLARRLRGRSRRERSRASGCKRNGRHEHHPAGGRGKMKTVLLIRVEANPPKESTLPPR
jgi:hypothetical protein